MIILRQKSYSKFSDIIEKITGFKDASKYEEYKPKDARVIAQSVKRKATDTGTKVKGMIIKRIPKRSTPAPVMAMA